MTLAIVATDGALVDGLAAERPLLTTLRRHRQLRERIEFVCRQLVEWETESRLAARLEMRLNDLFVQEEHARDEMLRFPVNSLEDCAAKVNHLRWLLNEGESGLEDEDWTLILRSFSVDLMDRGHALGT